MCLYHCSYIIFLINTEAVANALHSKLPFKILPILYSYTGSTCRVILETKKIFISIYHKTNIIHVQWILVSLLIHYVPAFGAPGIPVVV